MFRADTDTLEWRPFSQQGDRPEPRRFHSTAISQGCLFVFGGSDGTTKLGNLKAIKLTEYAPEASSPLKYLFDRIRDPCWFSDARLEFMDGVVFTQSVWL